MDRKASWKQFIPFVLVTGGFLAFPFLVGLEDFSPDNAFMKYFYFIFLLFIMGFCLFEMVRLGLGEKRENKLLNGKVTATRTTATFISSKMKSKTQVNGRTVRSYHHIKFAYKDEYGAYRTYQTFKLYSPVEVQYLMAKQNFEVLVKGSEAVIVEDLNEYTIQRFFSERRAQGIYDNIGGHHLESNSIDGHIPVSPNAESGRYISGDNDNNYHDDGSGGNFF